MNNTNIIMENYYWLTIEPYCFITVKKKKAIIYNSFSKKNLVIDNPETINLLKELIIPENGMTILIEKEKLNKSEIKLFISKLRDNFMGDIIDASGNSKKPFQLIPKPFFEKDIDKIKDDNDLAYYFSFDMTRFLKEVFIYINTECYLNCSDCNYSYKQTGFCTKFDNDKIEINITNLKVFFKELFILKNVNINIIGGDIFQYSKFENLINVLIDNPCNTTFHTHYLNIQNIIKVNYKIQGISNFDFIILVNFPIIPDKFQIAINLLNKFKYKYKIKFSLRNINDFNTAENFIERLTITNFEFIPYYNGQNLNFIKKDIFLDRNDLDNISLEMREIMSNMTINSIDFGKFVIDPHGQVFSNFNFKSIGNISNDNLFNLIHNELTKGNCWKRIRNYKPCNECIYQFLCPPPSNIELAIGENKICNL